LLKWRKISQKTFKSIDCHRPVPFCAVTGALAGMKTDASAQSWEGIFFKVKGACLLKKAFLHQGDNASYVHPCRAAFTTRRLFELDHRAEESP
jgi:hypothetical protein